MADSIVINASPSKPVAVTLVGVDYKVKPPKMAVLAAVAKVASQQKGKDADSSAVITHIENIVKLMFNRQAAGVLRRLADPEDDLDYQQIMDTAEAVIEAQTGNPTS